MEKLLHTEKELVKKLNEGDSFAFEVLFYKYRNKIKGFALKIVPAQIDPEEIVQEVFVRVWLKKEAIDPEKDFQSYLFTIAKHLVLDHLKSAVNKKLYFVGEHFQQDLLEEEGVEASISEETEAKLQKLINEIPERRREIFRLSRFEGLSYKQIAERLNISENTVDSQIRNALVFLRKEFRKFVVLSFLYFFQ
ncbi:RNA polymerase ECF-type sigma factor [Aquipluma nitroreducens]|uniref:RNA polymerase ECF-type sigma factor n=1 Tax=Aquipluma nitroreducens TaxID=2010828 RepID=A0A5K7S6N0_9BACT|nr:RNA polymerase sigma-70 factor [Aquipluma nitroreducens]BBE17160.1 RNA polymerase ECF-type sigma factor [Aquipluma nitroreducens]